MLAHAISKNSHGNVGVHSYSSDGKAWTMGSPSVAYTTDVVWDDNTNTTLSRRERPVLVFERRDDCDFVPVALINGALNKTEAVGGSVQASDFKNTPTYTLIQPVLSS